ncbi:MAG: heme o synthase [Alphaproteobacteria bacterium]|nr:heme o synthase [Alphaproteobacteria bacterium]
MSLASDTATPLRAGASLAGPSDYLTLLKPRVMSLVIFTALTTIIVAPGAIHPVVAFAALLCIAVGAGASGALNQWFDADIDAIMVRTRSRPVPSGKITAQEALEFGSILAAFSVFAMAFLVGYVPAILLAVTIGFYLFVYTMWLKRLTVQNIVIGGAAGALPPVIGWAAVTGNAFDALPWLLFLIIFVWTPPHFWALALAGSDDYARAKVPMLPVVKGSRVTRNHILFYSLVLAPVAVSPYALNLVGPVYAAVAAIGGLGFVGLAVALWRASEKTERASAMRLFAYSIFYLFAIFTALAVERLIGFAPGA